MSGSTAPQEGNKGTPVQAAAKHGSRGPRGPPTGGKRSFPTTIRPQLPSFKEIFQNVLYGGGE